VMPSYVSSRRCSSVIGELSFFFALFSTIGILMVHVPTA
jgi:hypothetical protein